MGNVICKRNVITMDKNNYNININHIKLTVPNNNLVSLCKKLDSQFSLFHGEKIDMEPEPIELLLNVVLSGEGVASVIRLPL